MSRSKTAFLPTVLCLLLCGFAINACAPGAFGSRSQSQWELNKRRQPPADMPPRPLSEIYRENAQNAIARTGIDPNAAAETPSGEVAQTIPTPPIQNTTATLTPVKVAILLPLSGKHKDLGESMLKAAQIALFDIGHPNLQLLPQDTKATPAGASAAARTALGQGAQIVLGPVFAESVRAVKPITAAARVNMIAFSTDWTLANAGRTTGNTFIMGFLPFDQVERLTKHIAADQTINRVGLIAPQTNYGRAVTSAYDNISRRYGLATTHRESYAPRTANLAPNIRRFTLFDERKAAQTGDTPPPVPFDAVLMPVGGQQASSIANLLTHFDLPPRRVKRLGTGLFDDPSLARETSLDGAWFAAPSPALRRDYEQKFRATYNAAPPRLSTLAYDATALSAVLALRGQQQNGVPAFDHASISNPNGFFGIDGIFRFRPDGTAERGLAILEFRRGTIAIIDDAPKTFEPANFQR